VSECPKQALRGISPQLLDELATYECPDCGNDVEIWLDTLGMLHLNVLHDDTCPSLAARRKERQ
jgi:hypothetical protein